LNHDPNPVFFLLKIILFNFSLGHVSTASDLRVRLVQCVCVFVGWGT
jgi:hypothetical protein